MAVALIRLENIENLALAFQLNVAARALGFPREASRWSDRQMLETYQKNEKRKQFLLKQKQPHKAKAAIWPLHIAIVGSAR